MAVSDAIRKFGVPDGAAGISVYESAGLNTITDQKFGGSVYWGVLKRGEPDTYIPVRSLKEYHEMFGDTRNTNWHLFDNGQLTPDAITSYFRNAGDSGMLWICRLGLDGRGKKAEVTLRNRAGAGVLKVTAANMGRWAGYAQKIENKAVVVATPVTFTVSAPGVEANEFIGAKVTFSSGTSNSYEIVANTKAHPTSGEVIFTVSAQYNLLTDGVSGPTSLSGTSSYSRRTALTGTIAAPAANDATGTIAISGTVLVGTGTSFLTEFSVGGNIYYQGEARVVQSISSNTTLTIAAAFTVTTATGVTVQKDNFVVTGTGTNFTSDMVGKDIYVTIAGTTYARTVASRISATSITLTSAFPIGVTAGATALMDNYWVIGTGSNYGTQLVIGDRIIDPARMGDAVAVLEVDPVGQRFRVATQFPTDFTAASLVKQVQDATVALTPGRNEGLGVVVTPGTQSPATKFNFEVFFNGSSVYRKTDISLDPADPDFVESIVNDGNLSYRSGSTQVYKWLTVESLHNGSYTTNPSIDVRPINAGGDVLLSLANRLYTVADIDYSAAIGENLYPDPYQNPRSTVRIRDAKPAIDLEGTISSLGVNVTGTGTDFSPTIRQNDYIYAAGQLRQVRVVVSDTSLILYSAFASDLPALTPVQKAGYLQSDRGIDLAALTGSTAKFLISTPTYLTGGYDGDLGSIIPFHYTKFLDPDREELIDAVMDSQFGLIRIAAPGNSGLEVTRAMLAFAEANAFETRYEIPSHITDSRMAEAYVMNDVGRSDFGVAAFPSYGYISDPGGSGLRLIPAAGEVMGFETYVANVNKGWHHVAAGNRGRLQRFIKMTVDIGRSDEALLNSAGIQPIKRVDGAYTVYGVRIAAVNPTYKFMHIRRQQSNYIWVLRKASVLLNQLFRPNDPEMAFQVAMILGNFFRQEYKNKALNNYLPVDEAFSIRTDNPNEIAQAISRNDSADALSVIINGELNVAIDWVPSGLVEKINLFMTPKTITQID
jgi:hypothetical protein